MPDSFNRSSFIPQKSLGQNTKKKSSLGLFFIISILIFILTAAASIAVFGYKKVLESSIEQKAVSLQRAKEAFDPALIDELVRLDNRINLTKSILSSHISLTPFFSLLEELTLKNIKFDLFNFTIKDSGQVGVSMRGKAKDYATVVLQSDILGQNRFLTSQIFSDVNLDSSGRVGFSFNALVDSNLISFKSKTEGF